MKKKRLGIVGGGQLGRLIAIDAKKLGFTVNIIDPTPDSPAGQIADHQIIADYNDEKAIRELAKISDFLTFEIELANAPVLDELAGQGLIIHPSAKTLGIIKDKFTQKQFLKKAGIPVADFAEVTTSTVIPAKAGNQERSGSRITPRVFPSARWHKSGMTRIEPKVDEIKQEIKQLAKKFGYPLLLKARLDAYDGRGNAHIESEADIEKGINKLRGRKLYVEKYVPFINELAVMVGRNTSGEITMYPVVETIHRNNICHIVMAPAQVDKKIAQKAQKLAEKVMQSLEGAGMFGIELFLTKEGNVYINEIAPRVHNSGHYTIEANETSQFEQHVRAVTGMPLGSTNLKVPAAVMINILGEREGKAEATGVDKALKIPGTAVHIYGKLQTKPERKMGHITVVADTVEEALERAKLARELISI